MEFRLLGPLEIWAADQPVRLIRKQERVVLAILLLRSNEPVSPTDLIDHLWQEDQPTDPRGALQSYVSRLRRQLAAAGGPTIEHDGHSYTLQIDRAQTDLGRFLELREPVAAEDPKDKAARLRTALALWRGPALGGLGLENLVAGLEEQRWSTLEEALTAELALGNEASLLDQLTELVQQHPTREKLAATWLRTLYRLGRRADALDGYHYLSRRLQDEHGLDPAPPLRRLHLAILRDDHRLLQATSPATSDVPRELPVDVSLLVGRDDLLTQGQSVLRGKRPVFALWGGAGVGKSAAATRLAHQVAADYPDGQLFARLQEVDGDPIDPGIILGRMLRSLGLAADEIPETTDARSALFKERTTDLALLLLFDDVLDPDHVRPLLPGGQRCAVILTSRKRLQLAEITSLREVTRLSEDDGRDLLSQLVGREAGDPRSMSVILDHCAGLPLALRVVGSRLALSGSETAADFATALSDDGQRLDWLVAGDRAVRISMELTLSAADEKAEALFDRIALVGIDEFSPWVATGLLGCDERRATEALDRLLDLGLFEVTAWAPVRRLRMHSIVRSYAVERLDRLTPKRREQATDRFLQTTLRLTSLADAGVPSGATIAARLPMPDRERVPSVERAIRSDPMGWLAIEWPLICAAAEASISCGQLDIAARLALRLNGYLVIRGDRGPWIAVLRKIRQALQDSEHLELTARIDHVLFGAVNHAGRTAEAEELAARGLDSARRCEIPEMVGRALYQVAFAAKGAGDSERTMAAAQEAHDLIMGDPSLTGLANAALAIVGMAAANLNDHARAAKAYEQAAALEAAGTRALGAILGPWAESLLRLGELDKAEVVLGRAYTIYAATGNELGTAELDSHTARLATMRGDYAEARRLIDQAREVFDQQDGVTGRYLLFEYEAELAMAQGQVAEGRRIRLSALVLAVAEGQTNEAIRFREALGNDRRDRANTPG